MRKRWARGLLALIGTGLFLGSVAFLVLSISPTALTPFGGSAAATIDDLPTCYWQVDGAHTGEIPIDREFPKDSLDHIVMSENENLALFVTARPFEDDEECDASILINAPDFTSAPTELYVYATAESQPQYVVILSPQKAGTLMFSLTGESGGYLIRNVTVTNWMGLSPFWAQLLVGMGTVFGPILTVPWWLDRLRERNEQRSRATSEKK
jgi:hypothetical protein